jgi:hypothetical protein
VNYQIKVAPEPLWLGGILFVWLIIGGGAINALVNAWLL